MIELGLSDTAMAFMGLALIVGMFVLFVTERYPAEVIAIAGAALMLVLNMLPYDAALTVLSNPAPWTITAMFLVMGGLVRTGALEWLTQQAEAQASRRPRATLVILLGCVDRSNTQIDQAWLCGYFGRLEGVCGCLQDC